jgi:hypothetical protein
MNIKNLISGRQIRMARAALGWRVDDLSKESGIPWARIQKIERNNNVIEGIDEKLQAIKKTFENYGVVFCEKDEIHQDYIMIKIENS